MQQGNIYFLRNSSRRFPCSQTWDKKNVFVSMFPSLVWNRGLMCLWQAVPPNPPVPFYKVTYMEDIVQLQGNHYISIVYFWHVSKLSHFCHSLFLQRPISMLYLIAVNKHWQNSILLSISLCPKNSMNSCVASIWHLPFLRIHQKVSQSGEIIGWWACGSLQCRGIQCAVAPENVCYLWNCAEISICFCQAGISLPIWGLNIVLDEKELWFP